MSGLQERNGTAYYIRHIWDPRRYPADINPIRLTLKNNETVEYAGPEAAVTAIAPNHTNTFLAASAIDGVFVWDAASARLAAKIDGVEHTIHAVCFSNDDRWLFAAGANSVVYVIDARTWKIAATLFLEIDGNYGCVLASGRYWTSAPDRASAFFAASQAVRSDPGGGRRDEAAVKAFLQSIVLGKAETHTLPATGVLNDGGVRVRERPNLKGNVLGHLRQGERVTVLERSASPETADGLTAYWYKIKTDAGLVGWSFGAFIDIED